MKRIPLLLILAVIPLLYAEEPSINIAKFKEQIPEIGLIPERIQIRNALLHKVHRAESGWEAVISGEIYTIGNDETFLLRAENARLAMESNKPDHELSSDEMSELEERLSSLIGKQGWILVKEPAITSDQGIAKEIVGTDVSLLKSKKNG